MSYQKNNNKKKKKIKKRKFGLVGKGFVFVGRR